MRTYFKNQKNKFLSGSRRRRSDAASELKLIGATIHLNRSAKLGFGKFENDPNVKIIDAPIHISTGLYAYQTIKAFRKLRPLRCPFQSFIISFHIYFLTVCSRTHKGYLLPFSAARFSFFIR